jgi:hypothetical protein
LLSVGAALSYQLFAFSFAACFLLFTAQAMEVLRKVSSPSSISCLPSGGSAPWNIERMPCSKEPNRGGRRFSKS